MELVTARRRCCGAMTAGATGGLEYSLRWGCVANTAYNKTKGAARLGPVCLVTAQTFPGVAAPFVDRNGIPLSAPGLWPGVLQTFCVIAGGSFVSMSYLQNKNRGICFFIKQMPLWFMHIPK